MSDTFRRVKWKEKDPMSIEVKRAIEKIELEEAILEADEDYDDDLYSLTPYQLMDDTPNSYE